MSDNHRPRVGLTRHFGAIVLLGVSLWIFHRFTSASESRLQAASQETVMAVRFEHHERESNLLRQAISSGADSQSLRLLSALAESCPEAVVTFDLASSAGVSIQEALERLPELSRFKLISTSKTAIPELHRHNLTRPGADYLVLHRRADRVPTAEPEAAPCHSVRPRTPAGKQQL